MCSLRLGFAVAHLGRVETARPCSVVAETRDGRGVDDDLAVLGVNEGMRLILPGIDIEIAAIAGRATGRARGFDDARIRLADRLRRRGDEQVKLPGMATDDGGERGAAKFELVLADLAPDRAGTIEEQQVRHENAFTQGK